MAKRKQKKGPRILLNILLFLLTAALIAAIYFLATARLRRPDPREALSVLSLPPIETEAETENGKKLLKAFEDHRNFTLSGDMEISGDSAYQKISTEVLDFDRLSEGLEDEISQILDLRVSSASLPKEIYGSDGNYLPELLDGAFTEVLDRRLEDAGDCLNHSDVVIRLDYDKGQWQIADLSEFEASLKGPFSEGKSADNIAEEMYGKAVSGQPYRLLDLKIDENALEGPVPDPEAFGETDDPAVIEKLLERPEAKALIGDAKTAWNSGIERVPGTPIRYYLDGTILVIVWQQPQFDTVGTFSEIFIADGSQLRRKISGDELWSFDFHTTSEFARLSNAVLAFGGDFYYHGRECGIGFYQRSLYRFEPVTSDICYITSDGDMLFTYRDTVRTPEEAEKFVRDNDVLFSLCFGPVLVENGQDVTPENYPWGEVNDTYARSVLGMLGRHHYLTMNLNIDKPYYPELATLHQATEAIMSYGVEKAYALDGGQTATTVFNFKLVNPVQFGWETGISDIIYFATAIPES